MSKIDTILNPKTTNLAKLKEGKPFTWGRVIKIHEIGEYAIVEYHDIFNGEDRGIAYSAYVKGKDCCTSYRSLDAALAGCIAYKHEGCNHRADWYFMQMVKQES